MAKVFTTLRDALSLGTYIHILHIMGTTTNLIG